MAGASHIGRVRKSNQDSFFFDESLGFVVVCDGIGGRKGGDIASQLAVEGIKTEFLKADRLRYDEISPFLCSAIDGVNQKIIQRGQAEEKPGMGTTINCLMFVGDRLHIGHVGDSRTYLYYQGHLWQLTLDHNLKMMLDRGWMNRHDLAPGAKEEALVRSLGLSERCDVDIYDIHVQPGQLFITCSDGLTGMLSDRMIAAIVEKNENQIDQLPQLLTAEANRRGGRDNITVVVTQVGV